MKLHILAALVAVSSQAALGEPFDFQKNIGSSELDPSIWDGPGTVVKRSGSVGFADSRAAIYAAANVDGDQPFHFEGTIEPSGPTRISLYEVYRDSPEGTAYRDYHERYPHDTDWSAVAQEFKTRGGDV